MKKNYQAPAATLVLLQNEDVLTASRLTHTASGWGDKFSWNDGLEEV